MFIDSYYKGGSSRTVLFKYTKLNVGDVGGNVGEVPAMGATQRTQMDLLPRSTSPWSWTALEGSPKDHNDRVVS